MEDHDEISKSKASLRPSSADEQVVDQIIADAKMDDFSHVHRDEDDDDYYGDERIAEHFIISKRAARIVVGITYFLLVGALVALIILFVQDDEIRNPAVSNLPIYVEKHYHRPTASPSPTLEPSLPPPTQAPKAEPTTTNNNNSNSWQGEGISPSQAVISNMSLSETSRIGYVESPFNVDELLLLLESELGIDASAMDTSLAQETTGGSGSTVICGIKVQDISVTVECKPNAALCSVYKVDNSFLCE